jgi:hypothetical protein
MKFAHLKQGDSVFVVHQKQIERQERIAASKAKCDEWNQANPVGTKVFYRVTSTHTIGPAMVDLQGEAYVFIECRMGAVALSDCEVVE